MTEQNPQYQQQPQQQPYEQQQAYQQPYQQQPSPVYVQAAPPKKKKKKKWPWIVGSVAVLAVVGAATSGGGDKTPATATAPQPTATATVTESAAPEIAEADMPDPTPTETEEPPVEEDPYFRVGQTIDLHSWTIKITNIDRDANREMAMANMFNDDAQGNYVLVTYQATYTGNKRIGDPGWDLTWSFSTPNGQVYDEGWGVTPSDEQDWPTEVRHGGTIPVQVVFDIKGPVGGSIVTVEDDVNYADFKMAP